MSVRPADSENERAQREIESLGNWVAQETGRQFSAGAAAPKVDVLTRAAYHRTDQTILRLAARNTGDPIVCRKNCAWCCHEVVLATAVEIVALYDHIVGTFAEPRRARLDEDLSAYDRALDGKRDRPFTLVRQACPLLVEGECSVYAARPLSCRGRNSSDAELCRMWAQSPGDGGTVPSYIAQTLAARAAEQGFANGSENVTGGTVHELGRCLKMLMESPSLRDDILAGNARFPKSIPLTKPRSMPMDATSISTSGQNHPTYMEALRLASHGKWSECDALLPEGSVFREFVRLRAPSINESYDQIVEFRNRIETAVDRLAEMPLNPLEALTAVAEHVSDTLPYHGESVRNTLEKQGRVFLDRVVSKVYPHLCAPIETPRKPGRFRLGYASGALVLNNANRWALGWLRNHGPDIETYAINLGPQDIGSRLWEQDADHYYCLHGNLQRAAEFIRALDLDALIVTDVGCRKLDYVYFSMRLARVQCTAWGVPVTSGLPNMDYYLSSEMMEPPGAEREYTERLVRLPRSGLCYPRPRTSFWSSDFQRTGEEFFPFMAQNIRKWTPQHDPLLKRIADRNGRPLRFLSQPDGEATSAFSRRLSKSGISHEIVPPLRQRGFATLLHSADVSFDPPDWSGGNTTVEALTYGVPVVTLPGRYMRGRHSMTFLALANGSGLIAEDEDDYVDLIFSEERRREASRNVALDLLYEDRGVVEALDRFLLGTLPQ